MTALVVSSWSSTQLESGQDLALAGGGYYGARQLGADEGVSAAAGLLAYGVSKVGNKRRAELEKLKVDQAREQGKQAVMLDTYKMLNDQQRRSFDGGAENHEVVIPIRGYTTNDGVIMEPHDRVILTR